MLYIRSVALLTDQIDYEEATIIDILHCFGVIYIGSINEASSEEEGVHLRTTLALAKIYGNCVGFDLSDDPCQAT